MADNAFDTNLEDNLYEDDQNVYSEDYSEVDENDTDIFAFLKDDITEEDKKKKKNKSSQQTTVKPDLTTKFGKKPIASFGDKTKPSFANKPQTSFDAEDRLAKVVAGEIIPEPKKEIKEEKQPPYSLQNSPLNINEAFFQRKDPAWYQSKVKDEDEVRSELKRKLGKDFDVQDVFNPGTDAIRIFSKKTGRSFNYSWGREAESSDNIGGSAGEMVGGKQSNLNDLNKWLFDNSRYNPNQKEAEEYKASGNLSYDDALEAADRSRNWWAITKEFVKGGLSSDANGRAVHMSNVANLMNEPNKYATLFPENATDDQKVAAVRKVSLAVQKDANKILDSQIFGSEAYKMNGLTGMIKNATEAQAFYDSLATKNQQFIYGSGMNEKIVKQFFANRVKQLADKENELKDKEIAAEVGKKSIDENLNFYEPLASKSFDPDQQKVYKAWKYVDQLNESLFKLKSDPKYSTTDSAIANKEGNLQAELAKAKETAKKLSAEGDQYNHYFYNPATAKIAVVRTVDVNLDQKNTEDITQKVLTFTDMYHGMPKEALAKKFVEISSKKLASANEGNKKMTVVAPRSFAGRALSMHTLESQGVEAKIEGDNVILSNVSLKQLSPYTDVTKFQQYNSKTKTIGKLVNGEIKTWKNRDSDITANSAAINNLYLLNRAPSYETTNWIGSAADGLVSAINPNYTTQRQKVTAMENVAKEANIKLTKKAELENLPSAGEEVATATGAMIPTVAKIAAVTALTEGAGTALVGARAIKAFNALSEGTFAEKAVYHTAMALKEEAQMRLAGLGPTSGATFYTTGQMLPKAFRPFKEAWGRAGNNVTNFVYHAAKGGVQMDVASLTENAYHSINTNEKFEDYLNENYKDFPSWFRKTMGNAISFGFMGAQQLATKHGRRSASLAFASGNQISEATNIASKALTKAEQDLNTYKENNTKESDPKYKENLAKYKKAVEKSAFDYNTLQTLNTAWQQSDALKTDEGLKDYVQKENKSFFDDYNKKYGQTLDVVVSSDKNSSSKFEPPKVDPKTNEVVKNGKIIINRNDAVSGGIFNKGKVAHEFAHASDWIVKQEKLAEYKKTNPEATEADIELYGLKLDAEKSQRIVDILIKNFPDLMGEKLWISNDYSAAAKELRDFKETADPNEEGYKEKLDKLIENKENQRLNVVDKVREAYSKKEDGKVLNPAEVNDEIIKRVIEELGDRSGDSLTSPFKARGFFKGLAVDFSNLMNKNHKVNYEIKDANELFELLNNYAQSVHQGGGASHKYSDALARVDLSAFGDYEAGEVALDDAEAIKRYDAIQKAKQDAINAAEAMFSLEDSKESKDLKKELDDLDDAYENGEEYMDDQEYEDKRKNLLFKIAAEEKKKAANIPAETKTIEKKIETEEGVVKDIVRNEKGSISSNKVQDLYDEKGMEAAQDIIDLFKPITNRIVDKRRDAPGFDRELLTSEIETGAGGILDLIKSYSPDKGVPLAAYINKQLPLRAIAASRRLLDAEFKADVAEQKGLMADEAKAEAKEKASYKNTLDSNVFGSDIVKTMTDKILTIARTLKSRLDEPISLNRTVTPFIAEIRDEVGKQLDIDVKKAMGGKKDNELVNWLLKNKRYMLENMTTTWLMGANGQGGIPQAIQKRVDGKWVSYPEWVGKKIDRESVSTDNAGRTSGAELVRRLPNVFNNVSDIDYLGQFIGPDGNPIRGRKESGAKAVAEEAAFDIINNDLANEGPIFEAIITNQERRGAILAENFVAEVMRQSERGNVKQSKNLTKAEKDFVELFNTSNTKDKDDIFNYLNDKNYKGISEDLKNKVDDNKIALENAYEEKVKILKNLNEEKLAKELNQTFAKKYRTSEGVYSKFEDYFSDFKKTKLETKEILTGNKLAPWEYKEENRETFDEIKKHINEEIHSFATSQFEDIKINSKEDFNKLSKETKDKVLKNVDDFLTVFKTSLTNTKQAPEFLYENNKAFFNELGLERYGYYMSGRSIKDPNGKTVGEAIYRQSSKAPDIVNSLGGEKGVDIMKKKERDAEATKIQEATLNVLERLKDNKKLSNEAKAALVISMGMHTYGPFRRMAKLDTVVRIKGYNKDSKYEFEHAKPIAVTVQEALAYVLDLSFHGEYINKEQLEKRFEDNVVTLIPQEIADLVNTIYKYTTPYKYGENVYNRFLNPRIEAYLKDRGWILEKGDFYKVTGDGKSEIKAIDFEGKNKNNIINNGIEAVYKSLDLNKEPKGIGVFDFDDTVGITKSNVLYTMPDGTEGKLNGAEFAKEGSRLLNEGAKFDFSEFSKVVEGKPGPMVEKLKKMLGKFGNKDMFILTARPAEAAGPIKEFLDSIGIDIPIENITGLGNSSPQAKADWIVQKAAKGYNDFYFADDHTGNVKAVKDALEILDVKSKVQQVREQYSKDLSKEFNKIVFQNKGVESFKVFSDITAKRRGAEKNRFDLYVPPSAADFELLLYNFLGKGELGEKQKEFFDETLLRPYSVGNDLMDAARQSIKREYKKLINSFPEVANELPKLTPDKEFTYDQAVRVAMWSDSGKEIPGLSKKDERRLTDLINNDPELKAFKDGLIIMGRQGQGWIEPTSGWEADTIIADLHNITEGEGRKKFLGEFINNAEQIFGKWEQGKLVGPNMNKIEAVYGTNVREAIEDSIYRMTNGKNRSYGQDKETSAWSNWVNGSTGTIMFLNTRSAILQLIGSVNFLNFRDNNPYAAAKAFADQPQYWADFARIWNSDKMKERRGGLKEDVAAAEIANAAANSKNKAKSIVSYLLKIGYTPTQIADSFAIASGGAPFYRNRIKSYLKEGKTESEAERLAWLDFTKVSDETQQSGDPRDISKQQASSAGRLLLTFQNTAMQQSRIVKKAFLDLKNGRGDVKTNLSKIAYYVAIQNVMFAGLQQGIFAVFFNNEDEETKKKTLQKKAIDVADDVLDTILRGTGFIGGIAATTKNVIEKYLEESEKKQPDYAEPVFEFANISPPIGSKLKKAYKGLEQARDDKDLIKARGFDLTQNGRLHLSPIYSVIGKEVEAFTNVPLDRVVNKIENVSQAMNSQNQNYQRIMVGLGWSPYSAGIKGSAEDLEIEAAADVERKEAGKIKAKETRKNKRDSIANLSDDEYKKYVLKKKAEREARKDSINNLPPEEKKKYLEAKEKAKELKEKEKEVLKEAKADSIANLSPEEKAKYNKKVAEEKAAKKEERHQKYLEKKKALQDSLAGLSPREREKYKAKKKAERHQYYLEHKDEYAKRRKSTRKKKTSLIDEL